MRTHLPRTLAAALVCATLAPAIAAAASEISSAPHFLVLADRERIVLFADGPVAGAMADHRADGSIEITVPRLTVAQAIAGRDFDNAGSGGSGKTRVRLAGTARGDVVVRIESATPVGRVHAFAASKPARLTIDLLHAGTQLSAAAPPTTAKPVPAASPVAAQAKGKEAAATLSGADKAAPVVAAAPVEMVGPPREEPPAGTAHGEFVGPPAPAAVLAAAEPAAPAASTAVAEVSEDAAGDHMLVCRWRRSSGIAYCGPDPRNAVYLADLGTADLAGQLDRTRNGPTAAALPPLGAAEAYLNADVALLRGAKSGLLLPGLTAYEHALRAHPHFVDAPRARANVALLYHALGFTPELERMAREKNPVAPFAGVLLADVRRAQGERNGAAVLLDAGAKAGGITACLAARVRANLAADQGQREAFPGAFAELARVCPRTIVEDAATSWLRARAMVLGGEAARAAAALALIEEELPRRERALLLVHLAGAYDAAGNVAAARAIDERLASGALGRRPVRAARMALAARDAAEGKLAAAEHRFAGLPIEDAHQSRERADLVAASELLRGGNEIAALGMMSERKLEARRLAPGDQILLARALRRVGLLDEAQRLLRSVGATEPTRLPDAYFDELGALALAREDSNAALAAAEQWQAARSGTLPAGAVALRARARAAKGDARGANETLTKELAALDPDLARDVAVDLAHELRSADPTLALGLARGALDAPGLPPLSAEREAAALRAVAEAAEALGDQAAAQDAFARLASEHAGDPAAAGAAYRAARLATAPAARSGDKAQPAAGPKGETPVADDDPLARRMAAVGQLYSEVVAGMSPGAQP